jgi:mono/diheme cytochrome c family protein
VTLNRFNLVLGLALALVFALLMLLRVDHSLPNYQINLGDDMTYSPAYTSFEANDNFANGRTRQDPVPGTIARGTPIFHFEATPQDAIRAGEQLTNPFDVNIEDGAASAERGATDFKTFCIVCHGVDGRGNGPVAKRGFPPPPSLLTGKSRDMKDGQLFHILTYGQNSMPQFAAQLPPERRWDVINHIRRLQQDVLLQGEKAATTPAREDNQETAPKIDQTTVLEIEQAAPLLPEYRRTIRPDSGTPEQAEPEAK